MPFFAFLPRFSYFRRIFIQARQHYAGNQLSESKKESLDSNPSRQTRELREKQLEDEEKLFEEQSMKADESMDIRGSDLEEDEGLSSDNFSTPKGLLQTRVARQKTV